MRVEGEGGGWRVRVEGEGDPSPVQIAQQLPIKREAGGVDPKRREPDIRRERDPKLRQFFQVFVMIFVPSKKQFFQVFVMIFVPSKRRCGFGCMGCYISSV